jgi:phytoene dehydrogenase-like protein
VPNAIVIGAGPNGLVAATYLARAGYDVEVLEANADAGGAVRTHEVTLPGFKHDLGAAFFPFGQVSPALAPLDLSGAGLSWKHAPIDSAHVSIDGTCGVVARDVEIAAKAMGEDANAWRKIAAWHAKTRERMLNAVLSPLPALGHALRLGPIDALPLAQAALSSGRGWAEWTFKTPGARRIVPGLALHTDVGPDDPCGAVVGFVLAILASSGGFALPVGGAGAITAAMLRRLEEAGGSVRTSTRVDRIVVRDRRAVAVRVGRDELEADVIVADVAAPTLYLRLLESDNVPIDVADAMRSFKHGFGTFKMDWALDGPVPWSNEDCARAAVVHTGDDLDDLVRFTEEVRKGDLPSNPYLVIGQQSLFDPSRAPKGKQTLWAYSRVPSTIEGGWERAKERFADRIEARIESLAPGFRKLIQARRAWSPDDLFGMDANLIGGDLAGGSAALQHQLFFRPVFPYFRYRTPVRGLYLASSYTHPGAGVHGACGRNAAMAVLDDA